MKHSSKGIATSRRNRHSAWSRLWMERLESRDLPSTVVTPFTPRFSRNDTGDIAIVANTLLTAPAGAAGDNARNGVGASLNNNNFNMVNVDVDADTSTFNSSRATLSMPAGATVLWAGLYWGAESGNAARNQVKFQTPIAGAYVNLTGAVLGATGSDYSAFIDVTPLVQIAGNGAYTVANVQANVAVSDKQAGWSLVVVYRDPASPPRNLTVFDGFMTVDTNAPSTISTSFSGFLTPLAGPVNAKVGFVSYEGDLGFTGDFCQLNGTTLSDPLHPANNFFNSSISTLGVANPGRTPSYVNQMGFDATIVSGTGIIANAANSATVTVGTTQDVYYPSVITTAIDIYAPVFADPKTVVDLNGGAIEPGDILEYTMDVQNTAGDNATQTVLTDPIPSYTSYVPGSLQILTGANPGAKSDAAGDDQAEFDAVNNQVVFRLGIGADATQGGLLVLGGSSQVRFRVQVNPGVPNNTPLNNQATVTGKGATGGLSVSSASSVATATVFAPRAGLHLEMDVSDPTPNVGDTITLTLHLTNNGPSATNGVFVNDPLPANLTFIGASGTGSYNDVTGDWNIGTMLVGDLATLTIQAVVAGPNSSINTGIVTATSIPDPDPSDNTASVSVTPRRADLGVFAAVDDSNPNVGQIVTYTIALTNFGPDQATGIAVTDVLPPQVSFISSSTLTGSYNPITGIWTVGTLDRPQTVYLTIQALVTSPNPSTDVATISAANQYDPNPSNNSSSATVSPMTADLSLVKTVDDPNPVANQLITFTVTVTNSGPSTSTNVVVSELLPAGLSYISSVVTQGSYSSAANTWTVGTLTSGQSQSLTMQVRVIDMAPSWNQASVSSSQFDTDPGDNVVAVPITPQIADIGVEKQVSASSAIVGDTISYSVRVHNHGPNDAAGVFVDDLLPTGVVLTLAIPSQGNYNAGTGRWNVGTLANGDEAVLILVVTVTNPINIVNVATSGSDQFDPISTNNTSFSVTTPQTADLNVVKSVDDPTPNLGDTITFTVTVANTGPDVATSPQVFDPLPPGLEFVTASATAGTYDPNTGRWQLPNLLSGSFETLTLQARVIGPGAPINTAIVNAPEFDPNPGDNTATATTTPGANVIGAVYLDIDNDGLRNVGEPGLAGVTVQLRNALNQLVATAVTDSDGVYTFVGVTPGTYSLVEIQPAGYGDGLDAAGTSGGVVGNDTISSVPFAAGMRLTGYTFGEHALPPVITIGNASATEGTPLVYLVTLSNQFDSPIGLDLAASGGTATSGVDYTPSNFEFSLDGGTTWLSGTGPNGTRATVPAFTSSILVRVTTIGDTIDEPDKNFTLSATVFTGAAGAIIPGTGTILDDDVPAAGGVSGTVFYDVNHNGTRDPGESGIGGVTIQLTGTNDLNQPVSRTIVTGPSGTFSFTAMRPGVYTLTEIQPPPFQGGTSTAGTQGGIAAAREISFTLASGVMGTGNVFGETLAANLFVTKQQLLASSTQLGAVLTGLSPASLPQSPSFTNSVAATGLASTTPPRYVATGAGSGGGPHVRVYDFGTGAERFNFFAYSPSFTGGVRVAVGDVNGDGTPDIITGPGPGGGPHVKVFDGTTGNLLTEFFAFAPTFTGGIYVAAGDINNDGRAEIIVGAGEGGGPHVRVFDSSGNIVTERFVFAPTFTGGVRVASGDVNGDGFDDVMVAAGPGGGPHVRVFSAGLTTVLHEFFAYPASFHGGVSIASGDVNNDGFADIITAPASGAQNVRAFSGVDLSSLANFFAFAPTFAGGLNITARDTNGDGRADIIVAPASQIPAYLRVIDVASTADLDAFLGYGPAFHGGAFVG